MVVLPRTHRIKDVPKSGISSEAAYVSRAERLSIHRALLIGCGWHLFACEFCMDESLMAGFFIQKSTADIMKPRFTILANPISIETPSELSQVRNISSLSSNEASVRDFK